MASQTKYPTLGVDILDVGVDATWDDADGVSAVTGLPNNSLGGAFVAGRTGDGVSNTGYFSVAPGAFSIPSNATITGFTFTLYRARIEPAIYDANSDDTSAQVAVMFGEGGALNDAEGDRSQFAITVSSQGNTTVLGGPNNLWHLHPTPAMINGKWGVGIQFFSASFDNHMQLDAVQFKVDYTVPDTDTGGDDSMTQICRPDRATGSRSAVILQEETCWGTLATPGTQNARGLDFTSEDLSESRSELQSQIIRPDRMHPKDRQGNQKPGGNINFELQAKTWGILLKHALGGDTRGHEVVTTGSGPYIHVLRGGRILPDGFTIEKSFSFPSGLDLETVILRYLGCRVNEFYLTCSSNAIVAGRCGIVAREEKDCGGVGGEGSMDTTPTYAANNPSFVSFEAAVEIDTDGDGVVEHVVTARSITMTINNNIAQDELALDGSDKRADLPEDDRMISGDIALFFTPGTYELYKRYKENATLALRFTLTNSAGHTWQFYFPKITLTGDPTPKVPGRRPLDLTFKWKTFADPTLGTDIIVTIENDEPTLSTAV